VASGAGIGVWLLNGTLSDISGTVSNSGGGYGMRVAGGTLTYISGSVRATKGIPFYSQVEVPTIHCSMNLDRVLEAGGGNYHDPEDIEVHIGSRVGVDPRVGTRRGGINGSSLLGMRML
jgi:hypothetical protein